MIVICSSEESLDEEKIAKLGSILNLGTCNNFIRNDNRITVIHLHVSKINFLMFDIKAHSNRYAPVL